MGASEKGDAEVSTESATGSATVRSSHRVVVGIDGSDHGNRALEWAALQAARSGAALQIVTAYEPGYVHVTQDEIQRSMDRLVAEAVARVSELAPGISTKTETHEESPALALIEASEGADLLVVGTRGLGGFKGLLLGSVSQKCSHHARCPITIVP